MLTKKDMVKVILTVVWYRNYILTDKEIEAIPVWKRRVNQMMRNNREQLESLHRTAKRILKGRRVNE